MGLVMRYAVGAMDEAAWLGSVALRSTEAAQAAMSALAAASILAHRTKLSMVYPHEAKKCCEDGDVRSETRLCVDLKETRDVGGSVSSRAPLDL